MPIKVTWIEEPFVIGFDCINDITADDIDQIGEVGREHAGIGPLYSVVDFTNSTSLPRNLVNTALRSAAFLEFVNHSNTRWFAFVRPTTAVRFMIEIVMRNASVKIVDTYDAGIAFLRQQKQEDLPPET